MWTREAEEAVLIHEAVKDVSARQLLLLSRINVYLYGAAMETLAASLEELNNADFMRSQVCHQTDGFLAEERWSAQMDTAKLKVVAMMLGVATAGHRYIRSVMRASTRELSSAGEAKARVLEEWKDIRRDLQSVETDFREVRDALEHQYEHLYDSPVEDPLSFSFTRKARLRYPDKAGIQKRFDFSERALQRVIDADNRMLAMLRSRRDRLNDDRRQDGAEE